MLFQTLDQDTFRLDTARWILIKCLPFNFFDDKPTQEYFKNVNLDLLYPHRTSSTNDVLATYEVTVTVTRQIVMELLVVNSSKISFTI